MAALQAGSAERRWFRREGSQNHNPYSVATAVSGMWHNLFSWPLESLVPWWSECQGSGGWRKSSLGKKFRIDPCGNANYRQSCPRLCTKRKDKAAHRHWREGGGLNKAVGEKEKERGVVKEG